MIFGTRNIIDRASRKRSFASREILLLLFIILLILPKKISAQVITNTGASVSVSSIVVVSTKDLENNAGLIGNNGTINLTGNFLNGNLGSANGNGFYNLRGNWTDQGLFNPGTSTVTFQGITDQTITHWSSGEKFYKLIINNPGRTISQVAVPGDSLTVNNDLTILDGILRLGPTTSKLRVGGKAAISASGSAIIYDNTRTQTATITDILSGSGIIDMSSGNRPHVLNLAGSTNNIGTFLTGPASSSTVNYNGTTQTVFPASNYRNLIISNSGIKTLQGNSIVNLRLLISGGTFDLGTSTTTLNILGSTTVNGSLSFGGTRNKVVTLNDSLTGPGAIDMSSGNLSHLLYLYGTINNIGSYASGTRSTVDYTLNGNQTVFTSNDYNNLKITGSGIKTLAADITAKDSLTMASGDINTNGNTLMVSNSALNAIIRSSGKVIGKLQRAIGTTTGEYLYPVGSTLYPYNPLKIKFHNLTSGPVTAQFRTGDIGKLGLPLDDNGDEIFDRDSTAFWTLTSFSPMASNNFNVKLDYTGFTGVDPSSRIIKRTNVGSLELDGVNDSTSSVPEIKRDSLSKGISTITTDLAIGKGRPRITSQPKNIDVCEWATAFFQVTAKAGSGSLTYRWQVSTNNGLFYNDISDVGVYSGSGTRRLTITNTPFTMDGYYYRCIIRDRNGAGNPNITDPVRLRVNLIPVAISSPATQGNVCPSVAIQPIVLSTANNVTGTTFAWTRTVTNPDTIFTTIPLSGTYNIGDAITGTFSNYTDHPITITFTIIPTGPVTTYAIDPPCTGSNITATVTINPTPRLFPVPASFAQCDSTTTSVQLKSPSIFTTGMITFNYTVTTSGSVTGFTTPSAALPNNHFISDKLINHTDTFRVVTYRIVPVSPVTGCADGPAKSFSVTVNPTPRVRPVNLYNLKPDSSICFGGSTNILLTKPTQMSPGFGSVIFDYRVNASGGPGVVTGNMTSDFNRIPGYNIIRPYRNISDTLQSVYFTITPKIDNAACKAGPVVVSQIRVHPEPARFIQTIKPLTCQGGSDATLRIITSKGTNPQKVFWLGPIGYKDSLLFTITNLKGGTYRATITDNLGCSNFKQTDVTGAQIDPYLLAYLKGTGYGITCPGYNDGVLWVQASGGKPVYDFWITRNSLDTNLAIIHDTLGATFTGYKIYQNLYKGDYTLTVRDANGCTGSLTQQLEEPAPITVTFEKKPYSNYDVSCKTYSDGKVWIKTITGGNGGYTYQWRNSGGTVIGTTDTIRNLSAGTYYLQTTDSQACTKLDSVVVTEPSGMSLSGVLLGTSPDKNYNINCFGGSSGQITLNISGGSGSYTYIWAGPDGYTNTTSLNNISGLKAGRYRAKVRDRNGCELQALDTLLTQPAALAITDSLSLAPDGSNNIRCFGSNNGSIRLTVTGGSAGNYKYTWSTPNGSGIVPGQRIQSALTAGQYNVIVVDSNRCSVSRNITLTQPQAISSTLIPKHITCIPVGFSNGSIDLTVTGGMTPYQYSWSNGATTEDISNLTQGYYKVTIRDINLCTRTDSVRINLPPDLTYSSVISNHLGYNISCFGLSDGFINITPVTGTAPYNFVWTSPSGISTNQNISGLPAGVYNLQITDINQCKASGTFNLTEPGKISMALTPSASLHGGFNIDCAGAGTGTINVSPVNNAGTVKYLWSDGDTSKMRTGLRAGSYSLIITDGNNCMASSSIVLAQPDSIRTSFVVRQAFCPDSPDGEIQLKVTGGVVVSDYSFKWSDNSTSQNLINILRGKYRVTVTDANNCVVDDSVTMIPQYETCLSIPNAISPNGDNINDYWNIDKIDLYPQAEVKIFNIWGELLWRSDKGYTRPWDGRSNGINLPIDSYTYIIDLHNGSKPIVGSITIMR
jgi:gliding motility-associated-like protein